MKNKIIYIFLYLIIILLSGCLIIYPNINKFKNYNSIKDLTSDEKTKLINDVLEKYNIKDEEVDSKYEEQYNEINNNYKSKFNEIDNKYDELNKNIKTKYETKDKELSKTINSKKVEQTKEFFANGLSEKYYTISDEVMNLTKEKNNLDIDESNEKVKLESEKNEEILNLNIKKNDDIKKIDESKQREIDNNKNNKENEINDINSLNKKNQNNKNKAILNIIIGFIIILIPLIYIMIVYNKLTKLYNKVKESWSSVNVYLKQRTDLIPNLVEIVKGYSGYEKDALTEITNIRNKILKSESKKETIEQNEKLDKDLNNLFALIESYPELKADSNFIDLQNNLKEIENKIALARTIYNKSVLNYKNKLEMFPSNIVGQIFNFKSELFFEIDKEEQVQIKF